MSTSLPQAARSVRSSRSTTLTTTAVVLAGIAPLGNAAGFLEDSKASLETRNFYMNRDFRDGPGDEGTRGEVYRGKPSGKWLLCHRGLLKAWRKLGVLGSVDGRRRSSAKTPCSVVLGVQEQESETTACRLPCRRPQGLYVRPAAPP